MPSHSHSRVRLEIHLPTLRENCRKILAAVAPCRLIAVLKADAYGLGVLPVARALADAGVWRFAVAELNEALTLAPVGRPVQLLGSVLPDEIPDAVAGGVILPIPDCATAAAISAEAVRQGREATCEFKVDTGMGRLGMLLSEAPAVIRRCLEMPGLRPSGIYSHFPMAYRSGNDYTLAQIAAFLELLRRLEADGVRFETRHMANSDAINNVPRSYQPPFNAVRTGINLHGSFDIEGRRSLDLKPVLTLKARLCAVRRLPAGSLIGYGCTYRLPHEMAVGTVSAGYADGLPLALSNRGTLLIRGRPCPVLGRVSMDYTTVSLEQAPDAQVGDEVVCLGGEGPFAATVEDWAQVKGTHPYEIICSIGSRVARCPVGD